MTTEENKALIRNVFAKNDAAQNMDALREAADASYVAHFPGMPPADRDGMAAVGGSFYAGFPGMTHTLHELVAEGDVVAVRLTVSGKHTAPFVTPMGELPPSGREMSLEVLNLFHLAGSKVKEQWIQFDMMSFMQQVAPSA